MPADPNAAAATGPTGPRSAASGSPGRNSARWARTPIGPMPGPPPPWGMQNVLCRFKWLTSAPNAPGRATPTRALRLAPSTYTWPPASCTARHRSVMPSSKTPCVDGYVTMIAPSRSAAAAILVRQVGFVDVAMVVASDDDHVEAGHHGAGGVGAVGARRDQADRALCVATAAVVGTDREQPGELALAPGVRLEAHGVVAGDLGQPTLRGRRSATGIRWSDRLARTDGCRRTPAS